MAIGVCSNTASLVITTCRTKLIKERTTVSQRPQSTILSSRKPGFLIRFLTSSCMSATSSRLFRSQTGYFITTCQDLHSWFVTKSVGLCRFSSILQKRPNQQTNKSVQAGFLLLISVCAYFMM